MSRISPARRDTQSVPAFSACSVMLLQMLGIAFAQQNHALAGVAVRSPVPIVLMKADGRRQTILRSEVIDCASLSIIVGLDGGPGLHIGRQAVIDTRHLGHHRFPAKLVGIILRQRRARVTVLADWRREVNRPDESHKAFRADHRRKDRQEDQRTESSSTKTNAGFSQARRVRSIHASQTTAPAAKSMG